MNKGKKFRDKSNMTYYENISYFDCTMEKPAISTFSKEYEGENDVDKHVKKIKKEKLTGSENLRGQQRSE